MLQSEYKLQLLQYLESKEVKQSTLPKNHACYLQTHWVNH